MTESSIKAPLHLWIVGVLSLLWNAGGAFDYAATQLRIDWYLSGFTQEQLDYFFAFPAWVDALWAIGVWGSLLGSVALLMRRNWAVWLFGAAILGLAGTSVYTMALTDGMALMGDEAAVFTAVIWVIGLFLFFYSRSLARRGVLK